MPNKQLYWIYTITWVSAIFLTAWFGARINPARDYGFFSGLWHGLFAVQNWIYSWFDGRLIFARNYELSAGYKWGWLIGMFDVVAVKSFLFRFGLTILKG